MDFHIIFLSHLAAGWFIRNHFRSIRIENLHGRENQRKPSRHPHRMRQSDTMTPENIFSPLFTDLYELTMMHAYRSNHKEAAATFSLYIRGAAWMNRGYFVAAGLEDVLRGLETMRFSKDDLEYLRGLRIFPEHFIRSLEDFRFTGDVRAMPEGTICFADEPLLEVTAPIAEAQLIETFLINAVGFPTNIATKALRCMHAAKGRPLSDFSFRRTQGLDAGLQVARSAYLAGFTSTSNVLAGKIFGIPVSGTMAHSFVLTFSGDTDAFRAYARTFPDNCVFLIDTHDVIAGAKSAAAVAQAMAEDGHHLKAVRIDSGDMVEATRRVRRILDDAGLRAVQIIATSGFDEYDIEKVLAGGATIDAFGVGTKLGVSADLPYIDMVYKLARFDGRNVKKTSPGKITLAGEKQVFRQTDPAGRFVRDILGTRDETVEDAAPLLVEVMTDGRRLHPAPGLADIRRKIQAGFSNLDESYKALREPDRYPVQISPRLAAIQ